MTALLDSPSGRTVTVLADRALRYADVRANSLAIRADAIAFVTGGLGHPCMQPNPGTKTDQHEERIHTLVTCSIACRPRPKRPCRGCRCQQPCGSTRRGVAIRSCVVAPDSSMRFSAT